MERRSVVSDSSETESSEVVILSHPYTNPKLQEPEFDSAPSSQATVSSETICASQPIHAYSLASDTSYSECESDSDPFPELRLDLLKESIKEPEQQPYRPANIEEILRERLQQAREKYLEMVNDVLKELRIENYSVEVPPTFELMSDAEMEAELASFGFRFTTRKRAIDLLNRCWAAQKNQPTVDMSPVDFIREKSKFYEKIITYQPIPLASLFREMTEAGVKISVHRLKTILDDEGVAFFDEDASDKHKI